MKNDKEKLKKIFVAGFLVIAFSVFAEVTFTAFAAETTPTPTPTVNVLEGVSYTPLVTLPLGEEGAILSSWTLSTYLSGMLRLIIALGGAVAVFMAIIGGVQYVASGITPSAKNDAKDRITNAFIGLAIILTSYLLLNTISPDLVNFKLALPMIELPAVPRPSQAPSIFLQPSSECSDTCGPGFSCMSFTNEFGTTSACEPSATTCGSCVNLNNNGIPQKSGACGAGTCQVSSQIAYNLGELDTSLTLQGINWWVTEAWPPTRSHVASCQNPGPDAGTCVDANFKTTPPTAKNINIFIQSAHSAGLRAVYEVSTSIMRETLIKEGVESVIYVPGITGDHFSIYSI